jgi:hypothetical protein
MVQTFERYLPTAFDEGMTLLEKVNKIILSLNRMGKLSNDVLDQWNQVADWVMADGLDASIDAKIDSMLADGSLATIIGNAITDLGNEMGNLSDLTTSDKTSIVHAINSMETEMSTYKTNTTNDLNAQQATLNATLANIKYYGSPEEYGAVGDGVADDTTAIQNCLNACKVTVFQPKVYKITKTLVLPENNSIDGQHAQLTVSGTWTNVNNGPNVPQGTLLWVKGRQPITNSEQDMTTRFIKNLRFKGDQGISNLVGIFCGTTDQSAINQSSCVNYAVYETSFTNITMNYVNNGLHLAEVWGCHFEKINTPNSSNAGLYIQGQIVNNTFTACQFSGVNYGVYVDGAYYAGGSALRRPEGNVFLGGFIGVAKWGINFIRGLAFKFSNVIIDLNTIEAVIGTDMSDVTFDNCWLYCDGRVVDISAMSTTDNGTYVAFSHCNFVTGGTDAEGYTVKVNVRQNGIVIDGCKVQGVIYFDDAASGIVKNNIWGDAVTTNPRVIKHATGRVIMTDNTFKIDGTDIVTSIA